MGTQLECPLFFFLIFKLTYEKDIDFIYDVGIFPNYGVM